MAGFDRFAEGFSYWTERVSPRPYDAMFGDFLPGRVGRVLDVGCGSGLLSFHLAPRADHVTGIDLSPAMIRIANRKRAEQRAANTGFLVADLERPPFDAGVFDLVVGEAVLHDTEIERALVSLREMVRPGGRIVLHDITTLDPRRARSWLFQLAGTLRNVPWYLRRFGPVTTAKLLSFEASPAWIRHRAEGSELTPPAFERVYGRLLPGCTFRRHGWFMTAYWVRPADG